MFSGTKVDLKKVVSYIPQYIIQTIQIMRVYHICSIFESKNIIPA